MSYWVKDEYGVISHALDENLQPVILNIETGTTITMPCDNDALLDLLNNNTRKPDYLELKTRIAWLFEDSQLVRDDDYNAALREVLSIIDELEGKRCP